MIEGNPQPLPLAARVLKPETLALVRGLADYSLRGWRILDRWAVNSPEALRALEGAGEVALLGRLLEQQRIEQQAVDRQPVGMPELEALALGKVDTELDGAPGAAAILAGKGERRDALMRAVREASPADLEGPAERLREAMRKRPGEKGRERLGPI